MDQAQQVREKIDIVSLISEYLPLRKMGRNFTTVCPFHQENTPSFVVSPERQIWHCFGCGKGGDAFTFLMEYENLEFVEALRILAKKVGVTLKFSGSSFTSSKKDAIYSLNKIASEYYNYVLTKHRVGESALEYLIKRRGLSLNLIKTFNIGFAPFGGGDLTKYLMNKKKFNKSDLFDAGLVIQKGNKILDFFRGRIIFPLTDHRGNIAGFSGRNITDKEVGPKYINTRDTIVYHKGSMFFGLNLAKEEIKKEGFSIVMEGEFDVISAFKEGIKNAVALKGTALTENQALLLSRFAPKVALCLDQDSAGIDALIRSIPVLEGRNLSISVIEAPGKDPDEALRNDPVSFKKAIKDSIEVYDFLIFKNARENDVKTAGGKKAITDNILPLLNLIQNEIVKEHYLKKLSKIIDTSFESLLKQLDKKADKKEDEILQKTEKINRQEMLEEYLLSLIIQADDYLKIFLSVKNILTNYKFEIPSIGKIFSEMIAVYNKNNNFNFKHLPNVLTKELLPTFDKCFLTPLPKFENGTKYEEEAVKVAKDLKLIFLKKRIKEISQNLKNKNGNEILELREEIHNITTQLASSQV